jgi:hypothetical protein
MVNHPSDPYEAADAPLREQEQRLLAQLEAVRASRAGIAAAQRAANFENMTARFQGSATFTADAVVVKAALTENKFKGMGLEEACAQQLAQSDHIELTAKQIWAALAAGGFSLLSDRPEQSVSWALRKRERKVKDIVLVGDGKWGMEAWYSAERLRQIRDSRNNASTRNSAEHIERTKAGIANARSTRLDSWGTRRRITGEQMAAAYYAIQRGDATSKLQAAKAGGMVHPTFNFYWCLYEMENWKPNDTFPPARREVPKRGRDIRFEEMWPRKPGAANGHVKDNGPQLMLRPAE